MAEEKYTDRQDIVIEGNQAVWNIQLTGDIQGLYSGEFRFKCFLNPMDRLTASREHRELLGDNPGLALQNDDNIAFAISQLKQRVVSAPPFWTAHGTPGNVPDDNILMAVLDAAIGAELKYKDHLKKRTLETLTKAKNAAERLLRLQNEKPDKEDEAE